MSKGDIRKIFDCIYRRLWALGNTHIQKWINWRRDHQAEAMWHHYHKSEALLL
ncbi:MAG: hypothetical protein FWD71_22030 [Oscillospiraceae bacterium]|nr:hypothetical protein [Oscillospiraceae bacterium]